jgi:hypothetical protein
MKSVHHFAMQQLRSLVPSVLQAEMRAADSQHQLLTSMKIHGLQHRLHQPVADGDLHLQPTNHLSNNRKVIIRNYTIPTQVGPEKEHHNGSKK